MAGWPEPGQRAAYLPPPDPELAPAGPGAESPQVLAERVRAQQDALAADGVNGERPGTCSAVESEDGVIVALTILDWLGAKTLVGGFTPSHATVRLRSPLAGRPVIDNAANRARPHWADAG